MHASSGKCSAVDKCPPKQIHFDISLGPVLLLVTGRIPAYSSSRLSPVGIFLLVACPPPRRFVFRSALARTSSSPRYVRPRRRHCMSDPSTERVPPRLIPRRNLWIGSEAGKEILPRSSDSHDPSRTPRPSSSVSGPHQVPTPPNRPSVITRLTVIPSDTVFLENRSRVYHTVLVKRLGGIRQPMR